MRGERLGFGLGATCPPPHDYGEGWGGVALGPDVLPYPAMKTCQAAMSIPKARMSPVVVEAMRFMAYA